MFRKLLASSALLALTAAAAPATTFTGYAVGAWTNPDASYGYSINNADLGATADVTWGTPEAGSSANLWMFDGVGSDGGPLWSADENVVFRLGDFTYHNGSVSGHDFAGADLAVSLYVTSPLATVNVFDFTFDVINTPNTTGDPVLDGDIASIVNGLTATSFSFGGVDYTLELLGFSEDGGATLTTGFNSPEGSTAYAGLYGRITAATVPLPASLPLLAGALALLGLGARRRRAA